MCEQVLELWRKRINPEETRKSKDTALPCTTQHTI